MACVFSNIEQFLPVNEELLRELEIKQAANPVIDSVGSIIFGMVHYINMISCTNYIILFFRVII